MTFYTTDQRAPNQLRRRSRKGHGHSWDVGFTLGINEEPRRYAGKTAAFGWNSGGHVQTMRNDWSARKLDRLRGCSAIPDRDARVLQLGTRGAAENWSTD